MAEPLSNERLQPSLLDRLSDDAPEQMQEPRDHRILSMRALRAAVLRDLEWLLNCTSLSSARDLTLFPLTRHSVLNFGLPDLSGKTAAGLDPVDLGRRIRQAIEDFEPRIVRDSVQVTPLALRPDHSPNQLAFEIQGELWGVPLPERLYLKTEMDLEAGDVKLFDVPSRGAR